MSKRLARGLDYLLSSDVHPGDGAGVETVDLAAIRPNPFQPRRVFRDEQLADLAASIRAQGVLQPVIVRPAGDGYELVAGERRCRAARMAGLDTVPAVVKKVEDDAMLEVALVENLQREDLNAIEVAQGYAALMDQLGLTQEDVAQRVAKSRPAVANAVRLLDLPADLQELVSRGTLSAGHGRALLAIEDPARRRAAASRVEKEGLSVRALEQIARRTPGARTQKPSATAADTQIASLEDRLRQHLGTRVRIRGGTKRGRIVIEYYSPDELDRLLERLLDTAADD